MPPRGLPRPTAPPAPDTSPHALAEAEDERLAERALAELQTAGPDQPSSDALTDTAATADLILKAAGPEDSSAPVGPGAGDAVDLTDPLGLDTITDADRDTDQYIGVTDISDAPRLTGERMTRWLWSVMRHRPIADRRLVLLALQRWDLDDGPAFNDTEAERRFCLDVYDRFVEAATRDLAVATAAREAAEAAEAPRPTDVDADANVFSPEALAAVPKDMLRRKSLELGASSFDAWRKRQPDVAALPSSFKLRCVLGGTGRRWKAVGDWPSALVAAGLVTPLQALPHIGQGKAMTEDDVLASLAWAMVENGSKVSLRRAEVWRGQTRERVLLEHNLVVQIASPESAILRLGLRSMPRARERAAEWIKTHELGEFPGRPISAINDLLASGAVTPTTYVSIDEEVV